MSDARPAAAGPAGVACPQCGAPVPLGATDAFPRCASCRASLYVDVDRLVRHVVVAPRLGAPEARGELGRFLEAAEVDVGALDADARMVLLPWFVIPAPGGTALVPAAAESALARPGRDARDVGDAAPFDPDRVRWDTVVAPETSAAQALGSVSGDARLAHLPFWRVEYREAGQTFTAYVDAVVGGVTATRLPPSSTRRMDGVAAAWLAAAIAVFTLEAALLPGFLLPMAAFAVTGFGIFHFVRMGEGARR